MSCGASDLNRMLKAWMDSHPQMRLVALIVYYLGIILGLLTLYGRGDFSTPEFIYQNF